MDKEHPTVGWFPNLYSKLPDYIEQAIQREIASYNLPAEKAQIIADNVYATISASYQFDPSFTSSFATASPAERETIIRSFLRQYIKREIDIETENIKREVHQKVTNNYKENYFQVLDPRGKDYKKYRENVVGLFFPEIKVAEDIVDSDSNKSNYKSAVDSVIKDFNDGKITQAELGTRIGAIDASIDTHLDNSNFNSTTLEFHNQRGSLIRARIDEAIANGSLRASNSRDISAIHSAIEAGDVETFRKYLSKGKKSEAATLIGGFSAPHTKVTFESATKVSSSGDGFKNYFSLGMGSSSKKIDTNPYKYIKGATQAHLQANIADLAVLAATSPLAKSSKGATAAQLLEKSKLANDILNASNAMRHAAKLDATALSKFNLLKSNIEKSINSGVMSFGSEAEKERFFNALRSNDSRYLESFVKPGLLGASTFAKFIKNTNEEALDLGGATNSTGLTSRSLNFQNNESAFKKSLLDRYIYAAQLAYDPGYAYSEIKQRIKDKFQFATFKNFDVKATGKALLFKTLTSITINGKKVSEGDLQSVLNFYKDPKTQIKKFLSNGFKSFVKKRFGMDLTVKSFFDSYLYKKFRTGLKLKFIKNVRYLEQLAKLGLKKFSGPLGNSIKKLFNKLGGSSVLIKKAFSGIGNFFGWLVGGKKKGGTFFDDLKKVVLTSCLLFVGLYVIAILGVIQVILGAFSSNSSTPYLPGSFSDITFATYQSINPNVIARGGSITTSGNVCVSTQTFAMYTPKRSNWNNLKISDFEGTDNSNNCKIMCNARRILGGLMPGTDGSLNCNYNYPDMYKTTINAKGNEVVANSQQFWCTNLVMEALKDDDPSILTSDNRLVIGLDNYMKSKPTLYEMSDLAIPNSASDSANLSQYNSLCVDKANFQAGNPIILRINTCNDTREPGGYKTLLNDGVVKPITNGHTELVLKLTDTQLITISANNVLKKLSYNVSTSGCAPGKIKVIGKSSGYIENQKYPMYLCRMYQYKNTSGSYTCPSSCDIPANNYSDAR